MLANRAVSAFFRGPDQGQTGQVGGTEKTTKMSESTNINLADFKIHDETYGGYYTAPGVKVLLKTDHPKNNPELGWTTQYGKSRVFYLMLGHDKQAYANPNYPKLVLQGIHWAVGK